MLSNKKIVPHSGDPSSGYAAFRMTCWGDTSILRIIPHMLQFICFLQDSIFLMVCSVEWLSRQLRHRFGR
jgi:hypothetical protein